MTTEIINLNGKSLFIDFDEDPGNPDNKERIKEIISKELLIDSCLFEIEFNIDHIKIINSDIGKHLYNHPELYDIYERSRNVAKRELLFSENFGEVKLGILLGDDVNMTLDDQTGYTPLLNIIDVTPDSYEIAKLLIDHGADVNKYAPHWYHHYPIIASARNPDTRILELLLKNKADPNVCDCDGNYPLSLAHLFKNYEAVKLLHKYNVDPKTRHAVDFKEY